MELKQVGNNYFQFFGELEYLVSEFKSVEVDGERFSKTIYHDRKDNLCNLRKTDPMMFDKNEYDFEELGCKIEIEDHYRRSLSKSTSSYYLYSENEYAHLIIYAFKCGVLDKRILNIYNTKDEDYKPRDFRTEFKTVLEDQRVRIPLFKYGFNNWIVYEVSLETLFELDKKVIPENIIKLFDANNINLNAKDRFKELVKLINKTIKL
jgi:hypothetical protein